MTNRFSFRKSIIAFSAAALFVSAGIPGISAVTAWADPASGTVISGDINVRSSAEYGDVIDTLTEGTSVSIIDTMSDSEDMTWYKVQYTTADGEGSGWVRGDLLETSDEPLTNEEETTEENAENADAQDQATTENAEGTTQDTGSGTQADQPVAASEGGVTYVIASSIPSDVVPDGFQQTTVRYEGENVPALVMNNAEVYLLYMEDSEKTAPGRLVVYDMDEAELIPYISFETKDGFILLLNIPEAELTTVSDRFVETTCDFDEGTMDALQMTQADSVISESVDLQEFYYMYGVNRDGMYGWYDYDAEEGTIQESVLNMHYNLNGTTADSEEEKSGFSLDSLSVVVIVGIIVVILLLAVLAVIFGLRYRQVSKELKAVKRNRSSGRKKAPGSTRAGTSGQGSTTATSGRTQPEMPKQSQNPDLSGGSKKDTAYEMPTDPLKNAGGSRQSKKHTDPDDDDLEFL